VVIIHYYHEPEAQNLGLRLESTLLK